MSISLDFLGNPYTSTTAGATVFTIQHLKHRLGWLVLSSAEPMKHQKLVREEVSRPRGFSPGGFCRDKSGPRRRNSRVRSLRQTWTKVQVQFVAGESRYASRLRRHQCAAETAVRKPS